MVLLSAFLVLEGSGCLYDACLGSFSNPLPTSHEGGSTSLGKEDNLKMQYNVDVFREQFPIVTRFVYHLIYYRELWSACHRFNVKCEFWIHTLDAHLLQALMDWCKVFGSDGCNDTHWKNLSVGESDELKRSFREGLSEETGLTLPQWRCYWNGVKGFRDKYAAHHELGYNKPVPDFTIALNVAHYYDGWIREVISPDILDEPPLEQSEESLKIAVAPLIAHLLKQTKEYYRATEEDTALTGGGA